MVSFKESSQKSFGIKIIDKDEPIIQRNSNIDSVASLLKKELNKMEGLKNNETLKLTFKKQSLIRMKQK